MPRTATYPKQEFGARSIAVAPSLIPVAVWLVHGRCGPPV